MEKLNKQPQRIAYLILLCICLLSASQQVFAATPKGGINVAGGPGSIGSNSYAKTGYVDVSDNVSLIEYEANYYYIEYIVTASGQHKRGYVPINSVNKQPQEHPQTVQYTKTSVKISCTAPNPLTVYTGPSSSYAVEGSVSPNEFISLLSKRSDGYSFIEYNTANGKKRGYVLSNNVVSSTGSMNMVLHTARAEIGYLAGNPNGNYTKYGEWFGMNGVPWCAIFVSWVADKSGCKEIIPKTASCATGVQWFKSRGLWGNTPHPGAIVYFGSNGSRHVGIVESVENGRITTIEGNYHYKNGSIDDWRVWRGSYSANDADIYGYGYPKY